MSILQTTELKKYYGAEPNITRALDGVTLSIEKGEFVAIVGTSGSGKSTLLNMIGGLDVPTSGQVVVDGKELSKLKDEELTVFRRRKIGFIFQNYNLVPVLNVFENIVLPVELDGNKVDKKFMNEVVQMLGLEDKLNNMPNNLSGGQQQRVALARALIIEPDILLLDEPLSALDRKIRAEMQYEIRRIQQQVGITTIFVTHDQEEAMTMSDEILLMRNGGIEQLSTPENIYNHPVSLYASDFLGKANTLIGTLHQAPDGWTVFGDGWEFPVEPQNGFADGEKVCLAIRGEQTRILDAAADGATAAEITDIVFTGEICRITARAGGATLSLACINVQAEHYRPGQTVYVLADRSKTHYFKK